jgi:hypothetical protein
VSDDNKVVFLAFRNDTPTDTQEVLSCSTCKNKTWLARYFPNANFPTMVCAACGQHHGKFGWINDDET